MPPAERAGAHAEVVFLGVALAPARLVEQAGSAQGGALDVHAKSDRGGDLHANVGIRRRAQRVHVHYIQAVRQVVVGERPGQRQDRRPVGERRHRTDIRFGVGRPPQLCQPPRRNQRVRIQQHHVAPGVQLHAPVHRGHETEIRGILQQGDFFGGRELPQRIAQLRVWTGIVDDDQLHRCFVTRSEHARDAGERFFPSLVHRHDDIHARVLPGEQGCI